MKYNPKRMQEAIGTLASVFSFYRLSVIITFKRTTDYDNGGATGTHHM